jgi:hypothetical protein
MKADIRMVGSYGKMRVDKMHNEEFYNFYSPSNIIKVIKSMK